MPTPLPLIEVYSEGWSWVPVRAATASLLIRSVDTLVVALEMAAHGEGVALVNGPFADEDLSSGRLINPTGQVMRGQGEWGAICHREIVHDVRVVTLLNWLHHQSRSACG